MDTATMCVLLRHDRSATRRALCAAFATRTGRLLLLALLVWGCAFTNNQAVAEAQTQPKQRAKSLVALADQAINDGRFREAVTLYGRAAKLDPGNSEILVGRGMAHEMSGQRKKAIEDYGMALRIDPDNFVAMENLAGIYERSREDPAEAIALYSRALELDPRPEWKENLAVWIGMLKTRLRPRTASAVDLWNLGNEQASKGKFKAAHKAYSKALVLDPLMFQAYYSRGLVRYRLGHVAAAVKDFDEALVISPRLPGGLVARGLALEKLGKLGEAESDFEQSARLHPRDWKGWYHLSRMLEQRKKFRLAVAGYAKVLELKSKPEIRRELKRRIPMLQRRFSTRWNGRRVLLPPFREHW